MGELSHVSPEGDARMVDVGQKPVTARTAVAHGAVVMQPATLDRIRADDLPKGAVLNTARIAGIMAAKRTSELIPLCHQVPLSSVALEFELDDSLPGVRLEATARTR
ncbi:MAG: cyclic pyranopterin monophosphate synthase MoaC, partial [Chloroflexota bacterium]|nr:cyclic pyranopterin monophosphate synthase MoaC [Chloroflexota bacterium]